MKISDMPLTSHDTTQGLAVVWAALEQLDLDDSDSDQLNTAMAWIGEALGAGPEPEAHKVTIELTFNPNNCVDVDADGYDPEPDLDAILGFGAEYYNLEGWRVV